MFVNPKQYLRILHRREKRKKLFSNSQNPGKPKYIHQSRHLHAMNRERGKGGRFVSKKKINGGAELNIKKEEI